jgi:plastocyanin
MNSIDRNTASTNYENRLAYGSQTHSSFLLLISLTLSVSSLVLWSLLSFPTSYSALAQIQLQQPLKQGQQQQPNIKASNIYQTKTMVLGKNIKNLVIVIPDEAHEYPNATPKELRIVNQPYLPQNAVVNVGTTIAWFSADVDHHHSISLVDSNKRSTVYTSGIFDNFNASKPITFNNTGTFVYSGPSFDKMWPNYKMNGTITVIKQPLAIGLNTTTTNNNIGSSLSGGASSNNNIDTVSMLITPANIVDKTISDLKSKGFAIDSQYPFTSLRGGGSTPGGDKQQVLLVLISSGKSLNEVTSALSQVDATLPYR